MNDKKPTEVVLVDESDKILGYKEKLEAHKNPVPLHRAISVVILDKTNNKVLIHQRSKNKMTWPLFWTNPCCSHPLRDESYLNAANRRLEEEMGIKTSLKEVFKFTYKAKYDNIWGENELDCVFVGKYSGSIKLNSDEVADYKWLTVKELESDINSYPEKYTPWFKIILKKIL